MTIRTRINVARTAYATTLVAGGTVLEQLATQKVSDRPTVLTFVALGVGMSTAAVYTKFRNNAIIQARRDRKDVPTMFPELRGKQKAKQPTTFKVLENKDMGNVVPIENGSKRTEVKRILRS